MDDEKEMIEDLIEEVENLYKYKDQIGKIDENTIKAESAITLFVTTTKGFDNQIQMKAIELLWLIVIYGNLPIKDRWVLYWNVSYAIFTNSTHVHFDELKRKAYRTIYYEIDSMLETGETDKVNPSNVIVIVTSQFAGITHAPTRRVADYAYTIQNVLKKYKVFIINDGGMNYEESDYLGQHMGFHFVDSYNSYNRLNYKDAEFGFFQNPNKMPDIEAIRDMVNLTRSLNPALVLNVGASCLVSDLCKKFALTACIPCGTDIPVSESENLILCRDFRDTDKEILQHLDASQKIVTSVFNYIMPDEGGLHKYNRADTQCPDDAWVIVTAGNRLSLEITDTFMKMLDDVLDVSENIYFIAIGRMDNWDRLTSGCHNSERMKSLGQIDDASQLIRHCDLYIQPHRQGGGRAAFEAMFHGIPVVTTCFGDTWNVCGDEFEVADYSEMKDRIKQYYEDSKLYGEKCISARKRAEKLEDMPGMMDELLKDLGL